MNNNNSSNIGIAVLSTVAVGVIGTGLAIYNYKDYLLENLGNEDIKTFLLKNESDESDESDELDELDELDKKTKNEVIIVKQDNIINKKKKREKTKKSKIRKSTTKRHY